MAVLNPDYDTIKSLQLFNLATSSAIGLGATLFSRLGEDLTPEKKKDISKYKEYLEDASLSLSKLKEYIDSLDLS